MRMLVCDPIDPKAIDVIRSAGVCVDNVPDIDQIELIQKVIGYDALIVRSRTIVSKQVIDSSTDLKLIIRAGVGLDNINIDYAQSKGIEVRNTPIASSNPVAELTIGYLFALIRQIPQATISMKTGKWEKKAFSKGTELAGKTLGLVGYGRIGRLVAEKALALEMNVLAYDPYIKEAQKGVDLVNLEDLLYNADVISLHVPHTPETHYIVGAEAFDKMKDGVYIVNCGRGGTLDEAALYDAIASGKVTGAALDVYEDEKEERGQQFKDLPQVIGSPHIGAGTVEAKARVGEEVAQIAIEFANR